MAKKKKLFTKRVIANALIAGGLVFFGAFTDGYISTQSVVASIAAAGIAIFTQLKDSLNIVDKKGEAKLFQFV